jgi:hypothetical protein
MSGKYEDIIHLSRPRSGKRIPMTLENRAAQFSPFAALTGYEETIAETGRLTESFIELDSGGENLLDARLRAIRERLETEPFVSVRYFCPDGRKQGGAYVNITGHVRKIDEYEQFLLLTDGTMLYFSRIYDIAL